MKRIFTGLSLILSGLVVAILLAELVLKLTGFSFPSFQRYDLHAGFSLLEGAHGSYSTEGESYVRINGQGMRDDREIAVRKAPGVYRIALLGDSYAQALQVPVEKSFWRVLERRLNACKPFGDRTVEVLNFGVQGYSTAQELQTLRHRVWQFQPDLVLLAFYSGNDVQDNSREFSGLHLRPYFVLRGNQLVLDDSFLDSPRYKAGSSVPWLMYQNISQYSRVAQLLNKAKVVAEQALQAGQRDVAARDDESDLRAFHRIYRSPQDAQWESAWRVTEELIVLMRNEVAAKGATFVVVALSNPIQVHPNREVRAEYARHLGVADLFYPESRIKALSEREGLRLISLAEPFQKYADEKQVYLHGFPNTRMGFGHWNENGHGLAGKMISEYLCRNKP